MKNILLLIASLISFISLHSKEQVIITTDSVQLYVNVKGEGPYCLYIHGGPGSGSYWFEKFSGDFFERHFTMVYLDQRGTGHSSSPANGDYSIKRIVDDFEEVRNSLNISKWLTIGHSLGGLLQMDYVEHHPNVVEGMIMFNCCLYMDDCFKNGWLKKAEELLGSEESEFLKNESISDFEKIGIAVGKLREKNILRKVSYASKESLNIMNEAFSEVPNFNNDFSNIDLPPEYSENFRVKTADVKVPVLFYYGKTDGNIGAEHYKEIHFPNMTLWDGDVGHVPFLENKEDMEKAVLSFLKKWTFN